MAFTQDDLSAINDAIASGATKVKYADKEVEYGTLTRLKEIKLMIEQELGGGKRRQSRRYGVYIRD